MSSMSEASSAEQVSERYEQASEGMSEWFSILLAGFFEKEKEGERESKTGRDKKRETG